MSSNERKQAAAVLRALNLGEEISHERTLQLARWYEEVVKERKRAVTNVHRLQHDKDRLQARLAKVDQFDAVRRELAIAENKIDRLQDKNQDLKDELDNLKSRYPGGLEKPGSEQAVDAKLIQKNRAIQALSNENSRMGMVVNSLVNLCRKANEKNVFDDELKSFWNRIESSV